MFQPGAVPRTRFEFRPRPQEIIGGTRLRFATPLRFTDGASFDRFVARPMERRGRTIMTFIPLDAEGYPIGGRYRISTRILATAEIETADSVPRQAGETTIAA